MCNRNISLKIGIIGVIAAGFCSPVLAEQPASKPSTASPSITQINEDIYLLTKRKERAAAEFQYQEALAKLTGGVKPGEQGLPRVFSVEGMNGRLMAIFDTTSGRVSGRVGDSVDGWLIEAISLKEVRLSKKRRGGNEMATIQVATGGNSASPDTQAAGIPGLVPPIPVR